jgi:metal-responsive CopG/Arc/MetJ family transcriptional regulator
MSFERTFSEPRASVPLVLSRALLARINAAATKQGINRSEFIRRAVERVLGGATERLTERPPDEKQTA